MDRFLQNKADANLDITRGEKFVYVNTMQKVLRERYPNAKVVLFYDIACRVLPHLQVRKAFVDPRED